MIFNGRDERSPAAYTWCGGLRKSIIDYIIGSESALYRGLVKGVTIAQGKDDFIGSDHRLVFSDIEVHVQRSSKAIRISSWKLKELKERQQREKATVEKEMAEAIGRTLGGWHKKFLDGCDSGDVNTIYGEWKTGFEQACKSVIGKKVKLVKKGVKKIPTVVKRLYEIRNTLRKEAEVSGREDLFEITRVVSEKIKELVMKGNKCRWQSFCSEVRSEKLGPREFFALLRRVMGSTRLESFGIRNTLGEIVNNEEEVREVWRAFFEDLGQDNSNGHFDERFREEVVERLQIIQGKSKDFFVEELDGDISVDEIRQQLTTLKNWKAGGMDRIKNEMLKICDSKEGLEMLSTLLNQIWEKETLPSELEIGRIVTLFKGGDAFDCGDYRGISLLNVVYKLFSAILNKRLVTFCEKENILEEEQGGFREGRGCTDQIYSLYSIVAERLSKGKDTYICFIDIKKAYDRVWRDGLWICLADHGIKGKMWRMLRSIYSNVKSTVFCGGKDSEPFDIELGVRQGDVISPLLFSIFFNGLIKELKDQGVGITLIDRILSGLFYADDTALLADSACETRVALKCVDNFFFKWRVDANAKKSGVMVVKGGADLAVDDIGSFRLGGELVPVVDKYKYLGVWFNDKWSWSDHIAYILLKVERAVGSIEYRFWKNRSADVKTKTIAWKSIFRPVLEYATEVWWPDAVDLAKFERLQKKICKWILGCCDKTVDEVVLGELGVPTISSRFLRARLSWAGIVRSTGNNRIVGLCKALDTRRGRFNTWEKMIMKAAKEVELVEELDDIEVILNQKERDVAIRAWKDSVKSKVHLREVHLWREGLAGKGKAHLYSRMKMFPKLESYLIGDEFRNGGQLRFKLRSGTVMLNIELGRRSKKFVDRLCELCDFGSEESVQHFLLECPCPEYVKERARFTNLLNVYCQSNNVETVFEKWCDADSDVRIFVLLGECRDYVLRKPGEVKDTEEVVRQVRLITNRFITAIWDVRKKLLFQDLVYTSGAQKPRSGSAS